MMISFWTRPIRFTPSTSLCLSQARPWIFNNKCRGRFVFSELNLDERWCLVSCIYVSVFVFKNKYYTELTLIFQPIELFLSCYVIFNVCYSSYSYYLYFWYIVIANVYMYRRRLHKFTTCVISICLVLYDNKICLKYMKYIVNKIPVTEYFLHVSVVQWQKLDTQDNGSHNTAQTTQDWAIQTH